MYCIYYYNKFIHLHIWWNKIYEMMFLTQATIKQASMSNSNNNNNVINNNGTIQ